MLKKQKTQIILVTTFILILIISFISTFAYKKVSHNIINNNFKYLSSIQHSTAIELDNWFANISNLLVSLVEQKSTQLIFLRLREGFNTLHLDMNVKIDKIESILKEDLEQNYVSYGNYAIPGVQPQRDIQIYLPCSLNGKIAQYLYTIDKEKKEYEKTNTFPSSYALVHDQYTHSYKNFLDAYNIYDIFMIDLQGNIIYTNKKEKDFGTNLLTGPYKNSGLGKVYQKALKLNKKDIAFEDFFSYEPSFNESASFFATPIVIDEKIEGVFAFQFGFEYLNKIMQFDQNYEIVGLGKTGENFLIGSDLKLRSEPRFKNKIDDLYLKGNDKVIALTKINTKTAQEAINSNTKDGQFITLDYKGDEVLSVYHKVNVFDETTWVMITQMETKEALQATNIFLEELVVVSIAILGLTSFFIVLYLNKIINNLHQKEEDLINTNIELQNKNFFIETLMENTPVPLFYKDTNGVYLGVNKEFENVFGFTKDEIVGKSVYNIAPKEIAHRYHQEDKEVFKDKDLYQIYDFVIQNKKTMQKHDVVFHKKAYLNENGKVAGLIGAVVDVTQRKKYEKELHHYSAKLQDLNESLEQIVKNRTQELRNAQKLAKLGTWELDIERQRLKWCDEAYKIFEIEKHAHQNLYLQDFLELVHIEDGLDFFEAYNNKHLVGHDIYVLVHRIRTKNGNVKYVEERCETIYDANDHPLISRGTVQDITKQKKIENELKEKTEQLIQQTKLAQMGELISMIAHQWRQPLGSIGSAIANIQNKLSLEKFDLDNKDDQNKFTKFLDQKLHNISNYTEFLSKTIDDFRNFYKEDNDTTDLLLSHVIDNALEIISGSLKNNNISIEKSFNDKTSITIYKNEVLQVILNILKNSEDNFKEQNIDKKKIVIVTYEDQYNIIISISDNGGGIPSKVLPKIFDPYFSTKKDKNGTGIGLYMSKTIISDHHGGMIKAVNIKDGVEFIIILPKKKS